MGGVNASPRYVQEVGIGLPDGTVTNTTHQGGIVSVVCRVVIRLWTRIDHIAVLPRRYLRMFCRRLGGRPYWPRECNIYWGNVCHGRWCSSSSYTVLELYPGCTCRDGYWYRRLVCQIPLHSSLVYRFLSVLTGVTPVLVSEVSSAGHRGQFLGYVFIANCEFQHI